MKKSSNEGANATILIMCGIIETFQYEMCGQYKLMATFLKIIRIFFLIDVVETKVVKKIKPRLSCEMLFPNNPFKGTFL